MSTPGSLPAEMMAIDEVRVFVNVPPMVNDELECELSPGGQFAYIGNYCLTLSEAIQVRDWLNKVLP